MHGQDVLDLGDFAAMPGRDSLIRGVQSTLEALAADGRLDARHAGIVALLRAEANDYVMSGGIARTNFAKLIGEHLTMLLELEAPEEEGTADDAGARVTKLSEYIRAQAGATAPDVRDTAAS
jgi:hypothetical protein